MLISHRKQIIMVLKPLDGNLRGREVEIIYSSTIYTLLQSIRSQRAVGKQKCTGNPILHHKPPEKSVAIVKYAF
jgi:hypothetical protein